MRFDIKYFDAAGNQLASREAAAFDAGFCSVEINGRHFDYFVCEDAALQAIAEIQHTVAA